jgi:hypothetical protein
MSCMHLFCRAGCCWEKVPQTAQQASPSTSHTHNAHSTRARCSTRRSAPIALDGRASGHCALPRTLLLSTAARQTSVTDATRTASG